MKIKGEKGASLIEMSLIVSLIAVVGIANVSYFGDRTAAKICEGATQIESSGVSRPNSLNRQWNSANKTCGQDSPCPPGTILTNVGNEIRCIALPEQW